jgi:hypothetical protein
VKPENAEIDGALVGGASLDPKIVRRNREGRSPSLGRLSSTEGYELSRVAEDLVKVPKGRLRILRIAQGVSSIGIDLSSAEGAA